MRTQGSWSDSTKVLEGCQLLCARQLAPLSDDLVSQADILAGLGTIDHHRNGARCIALDIKRNFKVYLLTLEAGFMYYFTPPEPQRFSPYAGAGFAAVLTLFTFLTWWAIRMIAL